MVIFHLVLLLKNFSKKKNYVFCSYLQEKEVCKIDKRISFGEVLLNLKCVKQCNINYNKKQKEKDREK